MVETLVLRVRDPKDLLQVAIEDNASAVTNPASMLATDTPPSRILSWSGRQVIGRARKMPGDPASGSPPGSKRLRFALSQRGLCDERLSRLARVRRIVPEELARCSRAPRETQARLEARNEKPAH